MAMRRLTRHLRWVSGFVAQKKSILFTYGLLIGLALIYTALWYRGNGLAIGGDYVMPYNGLDVIARYSSYWNSWKDLGNPIPPILTDTPVVETSFLSALYAITHDAPMAMKIFFSAFTAVEAVSVCYLTTGL